jgi:hypothetical protein
LRLALWYGFVVVLLNLCDFESDLHISLSDMHVCMRCYDYFDAFAKLSAWVDDYHFGMNRRWRSSIWCGGAPFGVAATSSVDCFH